MQYDAVIVGAGVAGLACARVLEENQLSYTLLESSDQVGGRIRTDNVDGFTLDHGFQVLQTGYPDLSHYLNLKELDLQKFPAGVAVRFKNRFHIIADPRHHPRYLLSTLASPLGGLRDRIALLRLANQVCRGPFTDIFDQPEEFAMRFLQRYGFTEKFIKSFFVPFLAGACLDKDINVSSRVLMYLLRIFANGDATLPAKGMGEIPHHMARSLSPDALQLKSKVLQVHDNSVKLEDGRTVLGRQIVLATSRPAMEELLQIQSECRSVAESCLYYTADWTPPFKEPLLVLNGEGHGPVNNIAFPSLVAQNYAPSGKTLIAVVVLDDHSIQRSDLEHEVRNQCRQWFGDIVSKWEHIQTRVIEHALPDQSPPTANPYHIPEPLSATIRVCGEYQSLPGLQWALMSGRMAGEELVKAISGE
ncbi:NAD(P)/FAD-dependent oxidoreductase [Desulfopila sp. IMCC35008]|uniref:NAD(P)/FAD-dependent oxidoreductase n=1 Tax=Desulfopila sp. IMCC35008 TaxID=2653858 RepID=UPI0013D309F6|nr:NAD(P)/FAD-dependent oxidoreductase [Desulfopila sp. IMCC35008]